MVENKGGGRCGCLGGAGGVVKLLREVFGGSTRRKLQGVIKVSKCGAVRKWLGVVLTIQNL